MTGPIDHVDSFKPDRFEMGRPMLLGGLRQRHEFAAAGVGIAEQWRQFKSRGEILDGSARTSTVSCAALMTPASSTCAAWRWNRSPACPREPDGCGCRLSAMPSSFTLGLRRRFVRPGSRSSSGSRTVATSRRIRQTSRCMGPTPESRSGSVSCPGVDPNRAPVQGART